MASSSLSTPGLQPSWAFPTQGSEAKSLLCGLRALFAAWVAGLRLFRPSHGILAGSSPFRPLLSLS